MAAKDDIREFLTTRRAKITPDQAGLVNTPLDAPRARLVSMSTIDGVAWRDRPPGVRPRAAR
jgi:hypothetical protein